MVTLWILLPQCHVAAAMVAASTSFGYQSLSSCSSCSGSSNCGRNSVLHHHHHHHHHSQQQSPQQQQQQRESRTCTRCQSFHRHNHRQRRRSSGVHFGAATTMSNITKAIVTITPPVPTGTASANALTPSSMTSLSLNSGLSPHHTALNSPGSLSAATTPMTAGPSGKHCTFALTPITIPPPPNKVSFLSTAKFASSSNIALATTSAMVAASAAAAASKTTPTLAASAAATPSIRTPTEISDDTMPTPNSSALISSMSMHKSHSHQKLEMRQSCASQITTVEDVDEICKLSLTDERNNNGITDDDEDDDGADADADDVDDAIGEIESNILGSGSCGGGSSSHHYSNSHSNSSLSSSAAVLTRDNIMIP
ncbi:protein roadkill-like [Musca vetustissima]|uniref:protein roadkill-like n=1 Tax=Musca vetustissima TaxID=27455 RepID=UPI002AB74115|nr:protein roadkill-like [Musca vetustissima]